MSYIDAMFDRDSDVIRVVERLPNGKRVFKDTPVKYNFFYEDPRGKYTSIFGTSLTKVTCNSTKDFRKEVNMLQSKKLFESDINPVFAHLSEHYQDIDPPKMNVCFFDIETDFCKDRGYAPPDDPFLPITSIGAYMQWCDKMYVLAVPPKTMTMETAKLMFADMPEVELFEKESEMLTRFLDIIEDADVLTGWNSESFDIPFIVNRMIKTIGKDETRRLCHWNQRPKKREFEKFGKTSQTYDLVGRVHMDYLDLYRKYRMEERHSYKLDYIGEVEVGEKKVAYNGTLDQLYNKDFRKFVEYNKQDVMLLDKIDKALKYIDLANSYAHQNTVLLPTVMGAVAAIEQALINEAHKLGLRVPNRSMKKSSTQAAGAYVAYPKVGLHKWVGSTDINSLYPSTIRALNMSPETIVGQIRHDYTDAYIHEQMTLKKKSFAASWEGKFACLEYDFMMEKDSTRKLIIDWEDGTVSEHSADEVYSIVFDSGLPWTISANGTIFTFEKEGLIPSTLAKWYANRKKMQAVSKKFAKLENGIKLPDNVATYSYGSATCDNVVELRYMDWNELESRIESGNCSDIDEYLVKYSLVVRDGSIFAADPAEQNLAYDYWDRRQHTLKIALNSAYGSLLNEGCRFFDHRIGQSTTLSGRQIVKHMTAQINEIVCGEYDHYGTVQIYQDTDSLKCTHLIRTNKGEVAVGELFEQCPEFWNDGDKEYAYDPELMVMSYDDEIDQPYYGHINYIYRHRVDKDMYEIEDEFGNVVTVTSDHSAMVIRNGKLIEAKPQEINPNDRLITLKVNE